MINLIPTSAKRMVHREYLVRVVAVWSLLCAGSLFASALLLMPTYVLYSQQLGHNEASVAVFDEGQYTMMRDTLTEANVFAEQLSRSLTSVKASEILSHIESAKPDGVELRGLYVMGDKDKMRIEVKATAATRERLRTFLDALRRDAFFATADVPVSDLAKDTNLAVTVSLTLRSTE